MMLLRRADMRRLLRDSPLMAEEVLDSMVGEAAHGCIRIERLRFGPPSVWKGWRPGKGPVVLTLWPEGAFPLRIPPEKRARVSHPALAPLWDWGDRWEVRPWIAGTPLKHGSLSKAQHEALAAGVSALHDAGLAHGDVTPSNIIMCPDGAAVLIDGAEDCAGTAGWGGDADLTPRQRDAFALDKLRDRLVD